jgi:hypothetical protein
MRGLDATVYKRILLEPKPDVRTQRLDADVLGLDWEASTWKYVASANTLELIGRSIAPLPQDT